MLVREAFEVVQRDDLAEFVRQLLEAGLERLGIGLLTKGFPQVRLARRPVDLLVERLGRLVTSQLLNHGKADIAQNRHQPGLAVSSAETGKGLVSSQISFLHGVFGILVTTQEPAGEIIRGIQMRQENLLKLRLAQVSPPIVMLFADGYPISPCFIPTNFFSPSWNKRRPRWVWQREDSMRKSGILSKNQTSKKDESI